MKRLLTFLLMIGLVVLCVASFVVACLIVAGAIALLLSPMFPYKVVGFFVCVGLVAAVLTTLSYSQESY